MVKRSGIDNLHRALFPEDYYFEAISGYVYVIKSLSTNLSKIGKTNNPKYRINQIRSNMCDDSLYFVFLYKVRDMDYVEKHLHILFIEKRIKNEWFNLSEDDFIIVNNVFLGALNEAIS